MLKGLILIQLLDTILDVCGFVRCSVRLWRQLMILNALVGGRSWLLTAIAVSVTDHREWR